MVHKDVIERRKEKQKIKAKPVNEILDDTGHKGNSGNEGLEETENKSFVYKSKSPKKEKKVEQKFVKSAKREIPDPELTEEEFEILAPVQFNEEETEIDEKKLELMDSIPFKNGKNTLTIKYSKRNNRQFRIQIFLNDECEIRPVTYTGSQTGNAFWGLIKGVMKK